MTPETVLNRGVSGKSIAGSVFSPTSFATIFSGMSLPEHGVRGFEDIIADAVPNLYAAQSHETVFSNTINSEYFNDNPRSESIITETLAVEDSPPERLETVPEPFVYLERGPGGHAPYGDFDGDAWEYFEQRRNISREQLIEEYKASVREDAEWFGKRLQLLERRDLLEDTLVVYTSDHGELLGEDGLLGHNGTVHRKLVETPTVFIHPELGTGELRQGLVRHVDLVPTVTDVADIDLNRSDRLSGRNLAVERPATYGASHYAPRLFVYSDRLPTVDLSYKSLWETGGGHVFADSNAFKRLLDIVSRSIGSSKRHYLRQHLHRNLPYYLRRYRKQGSPELPREEALNHLEEIVDGVARDGRSKTEDVPKERLRELGYM